MGYKRCGECGGYCWLPGRISGYCPFCAAELAESGRPAPVVELAAYIKRKEQAAVAERREHGRLFCGESRLAPPHPPQAVPLPIKGKAIE